MGSKGKSQTTGYWYKLMYHMGIGIGPIDAFLQFRGGDKAAWTGELKESGDIAVSQPNLWGGEKDQGGIMGALRLMFGEADQLPSAYLKTRLGPMVPAWRGLTTVIFSGAYGANNPYPQKASYKIRKIKAGWDGPCWYPEKADILVVSRTDKPGIPVTWSEQFANGLDDYSVVTGTKAAFSVASGTLSTLPTPGNYSRISRPVPGTGNSTFRSLRFLFRLRTATDGDAGVVQIYDGSGVYVHGFNPRWAGAGYKPIVGYNSAGGFTAAIGSAPLDTLTWYRYEAVYDDEASTLTCRVFRNDSGALWGEVSIGGNARPIGELWLWARNDVVDIADISVGHLKRDADLYAMNPAHILYYARTHADIGREPTANMNEASFRASADRLHSEGFGICCEFDPGAESLDEFEQRICRLIGGSVSRSLVDGQYYLDLARGDYVIEDLPVITDDDILDFKLQPAILDGAVNSLSIKYFDPEKKEAIVTPPAQALGLIDAFGTIHQVVEYPEIPDSTLATVVSERDLRASCTPKNVFDLVLIPDAVREIRPNQYFCLRTPKRGIANMVCLLGEKQAGTLKSGSVKVTAAQDVYSLPSTAFVEVEPGVDTRPDPIPYPITAQAVFEASYIELIQRIDRANMDVMPVDAGYLIAVAGQPSKGGRSYDLAVLSASGEFEGGHNGEWCPMAIVAGDPVSEVISRQQVVVPISLFSRSRQVIIGSAALWDSEIVRVDAFDDAAVTLGRGCGDTVPVPHAGGSRIWFYDDAGSSDLFEYTDGETVVVKLLTNTGSQQLAEIEATAMSVTFDQRQARPYPPANVLLDGQSYPQQLVLSGDLAVSAAHRDRIAQADQLFDQSMASIGPEAGTTYVVRNVDAVTGVETYFADGITSWPHIVPSADLAVANRLEVYSIRDGIESWQRVVVEFSLGQLLLTESGDLITTENGQPIQME